jgi:hypothetical protein
LVVPVLWDEISINSNIMLVFWPPCGDSKWGPSAAMNPFCGLAAVTGSIAKVQAHKGGTDWKIIPVAL